MIASAVATTAIATAEDRRAKYLHTDYLSTNRVMLEYEMPLAEIITDFHDKLKSITRGYGTLDYEFIGYCAVDLVKRGDADAVVSAGHTGASVAASMIKLRTLEGIDRPGIAALFNGALFSALVVRTSKALMRSSAIRRIAASLRRIPREYGAR